VVAIRNFSISQKQVKTGHFFIERKQEPERGLSTGQHPQGLPVPSGSLELHFSTSSSTSVLL